MKHVELPSGGIARVSKDVKPETIEALDEMMTAVAKSAEKFPDGCTAIYRGQAVRVVKRVKPLHGNEAVSILYFATNRATNVPVKYLLTQDEWDKQLERIFE